MVTSANRTRYIWRLETPAGEGPYSAGLCRDSMCDGDYYGYDTHPGPSDVWVAADNEAGRDRMINRLTCDHLFGFDSVRQARWWWTSGTDLRRWHREAGLRLVAYLADDCRDTLVSDRQVAFIPADRVAVLPAHFLHSQTITQLHQLAAAQIGA